MDYIKSYKKESPFLNVMGMGGGISSLLTLASGEITYIDDVFSTFLYDGTGSAQTINNGIDLDGEGGMVWTKSRSASRNHSLHDSARGVTCKLRPNGTNAEYCDATQMASFNSNGFTVGTDGSSNTNGDEYCSWTFRKCPGFFDVVTWTTTSDSAEQISHNLGSTPGMIIVKRTDATSNWIIWHRSLSNSLNDFLRFDNSDKQSAVGVWGSNAPNSTHFEYDGGASGRTFVAYVFAHNDGSFGEDSDEAVIKCDSYTGTQSEDTEINVGFEPQYLLIKNTSSGSTDWVVVDNMRGLPVGSDSEVLKANSNSTPASYRAAALTPTGFKLGQAVASVNGSGDTYIYIAIRRPHKSPEAGTDVFKPELLTSASQTFNPGFAPDMNWHMFDRSSSSGFAITGTRLTGNGSYLQTYSTGAEAGSSGSNWEYDAPTGKFTQGISTGSTGGGIEYFFKRAPGFLDIVTWTGNGVTGRTINHNLGVAPEFMIVKRRSGSENWYIYHKQPGATKAASFNLSGFSSAGVWDDTEPTATTVALMGDNAVNGNNETYVGYFFASLNGISKVGSYSGGSSASNIDIDCGFTSGARFVLIKRVDNYTSSANWFIYDSARGIVSGNDPYLKLNGGTEVTNTDYIDPLNAGFTVTSSGPSGINGDDGTFMFLAIA